MIDFIDLKTQQIRIKSELYTAIQRVLDYGEYTLGPEVAELEERLAAYALIVGVPARQIGWMSEFGEQLALPLQGKAEAICQYTGTYYILHGKKIIKQVSASKLL